MTIKTKEVGWYNWAMPLIGEIMPECVPIKDLKDTARFSEKVKNADGPITVTKNGYDEFVVMTCEEYEAMRTEIAKAKLLARIGLAEQEYAEGKYVDYETATRELRQRYGI